MTQVQRNRQMTPDGAARPQATPIEPHPQKPKAQAAKPQAAKGPKGQSYAPGPKNSPAKGQSPAPAAKVAAVPHHSGPHHPGPHHPGPHDSGPRDPGPLNPVLAPARPLTPAREAIEVTEDGQPVQVVVGEWPALVRLFERASPVSMSHWNPLTGQTFELPRGKQRRATGERFEQKLMREDDDGAAWAEIPYEESDTEYKRAVAFAEGLRPGTGRAELLAALNGPKPFRGFRTVLGHHPGLERRWTSVSTQAAEERLAEFCLAQGWRLADDRFEVAVERWLEAQEKADGEGGDEEFAAPRLVARSTQQLSLGRRGSGEDQ
jgi:hypothetical protein